MKIKYILAMTALMITGADGWASEAFCSMSAPTVNVTAGNPTEIAVDLENDTGIRGVQCDVFIPSGFDVDLDGIALTERAAGHSISASRVEDGRIIITIVSLASEAIKGTSGRLFTIPVTPQCEEGCYNVDFSYVILSTTSNERYKLPDFTGMINVLPPVSYRVEMANMAALKGETFDVNVTMTSERKVQGMQFDLLLPDGMLPQLDDIALDARASDLAARATCLDDGRIVVTIISTNGKLIQGNSGNVITIPVIASTEVGQYSVGLQYIILSVPEVGRVQCDDVEAQLTVGSTGMAQISSGLKVFGRDLNIVIDGALDGDIISVTDTAGHQLYKGTRHIIPVPAHDVYLVTINGKTHKIIL